MWIRRFVPFAALAAAAFALSACGGGGGGAASAPASSAAPPATSAPPGMITITAPLNASTVGYTEKTVTAPANTPFTIHFVNQDPGIPHNVQIFKGTDTSGTPIWAPEKNETVKGPDTDDYEISALPPGTYTFNCYVHPTAMVGTLIVQ